MANKRCKTCGQRKIMEDFTDFGDSCKTCTPEVKEIKPPKPIKLVVERLPDPKPKFNDEWLGKNKGN